LILAAFAFYASSTFFTWQPYLSSLPKAQAQMHKYFIVNLPPAIIRELQAHQANQAEKITNKEYESFKKTISLSLFK